MKNNDSFDRVKLEGKIAVVTGSSQGLGQEIALAFAKCGASVILADVTYPEETTHMIGEIGVPCLPLVVDVSNEADVILLRQEAISKFNRVDILVNNAGISQLSYTPTQELSVEEWDKILGVNLRGTFLCCKHIGKVMIKRKQGVIVNIASTAGITGVKRAPAYCASKAGIILLTKSLALEWASYNIRVNAIAPHYLETPLTRGLREADQVYQELTKVIPLKRFGKTSEVAGAVLFLCSYFANYITGSVLVVDGGYLAQ